MLILISKFRSIQKSLLTFCTFIHVSLYNCIVVLAYLLRLIFVLIGTSPTLSLYDTFCCHAQYLYVEFICYPVSRRVICSFGNAFTVCQCCDEGREREIASQHGIPHFRGDLRELVKSPHHECKHLVKALLAI